MSTAPSTDRIEVFFSYSHEDEAFCKELIKHLGVMKRLGQIDDWYDRNISAGTEWKQEIDRHLELATVILLLVSVDFIESDYCYEIELKRAMERHDNGEARVIPVILRPTDNWQKTPFGKLAAIPTDGKPISTWSDRDEAFAHVARQIRLAVESILQQRQPSDPQ